MEGNFAPRLLHPQERTHVLTKRNAGGGGLQSQSGPFGVEQSLAPAGGLSRLRYSGAYSTGVTEQNYERTEACVGHLVV